MFAVKILDFEVSWGYCPKKGDFMSRTDMYHHVKFDADRCQRGQDRKIERSDYSRLTTKLILASRVSVELNCVRSLESH